MARSVTWAQALAWRLRRQFLDPVGEGTAVDVVRRLCGAQAQVASSAELAIRVRQSVSSAGEVADALADGSLVKTWAMRGTLHYLVPDDAGAFLSLLAAGRTWERPSWVRAFGVGPKDWDVLRPAVRQALDGRALTRDELIEAVVAIPGLGHLREALRSGWGTLLKPLAWQGDLVYGPSRGNRVTFTSPRSAVPGWIGVPAADEAATIAIPAYLGAYGPADAERFSAWLSRGWMGKRLLRGWFAALGDRLAEVDVEGEVMYVLAEHLDELVAARPSDAVRLLPGFDAWVLGPGTDHTPVLPAYRRGHVSRTAGWIAPVLVAGGVVAGTWELEGDVARVEWFPETGELPRAALDEEVGRLSSIVGRPLEPAVSVTPA